MNNSFERSCLRWPGNKYSLLNNIIELLPTRFINYHEPFLGSATVFLNIPNYEKSFLSDKNDLLINFYKQIQSNQEELISIIKKKENTKDYFYKERNKIYNNPVEQAAQFYYLNRTCFNGIFRVNSNGKFNVPYGYRENFEILDKKKIVHLSNKFKNANLEYLEFYDTLDNINKGDFVFLDPPYSSKRKSSSFTMYNEKLFLWDDQIRLLQYCQVLIEKKALFMITNLYNQEVYNLFAKKLRLKTYTTKRYSGIGSKIDSRGTYTEYIFINY